MAFTIRGRIRVQDWVPLVSDGSEKGLDKGEGLRYTGATDLGGEFRFGVYRWTRGEAGVGVPAL